MTAAACAYVDSRLRWRRMFSCARTSRLVLGEGRTGSRSWGDRNYYHASVAADRHNARSMSESWTVAEAPRDWREP